MTTNLFPGLPPMPKVDLTLEQDLKMRQMTDAFEQVGKEELIFVALHLQRLNFVLSNNITQLLQQWPSTHPITTEDLLKSGISSETSI